METVLLELENVLAKVMLKASNVMSVKIPTRVGQNAQIVKTILSTLNKPLNICFLIECNCNVNGTENGSQTCDDLGQCKCKCDVTGLQCDKCEDGHQGFPDCHGKKLKSIKKIYNLQYFTTMPTFLTRWKH